MRFVEPTLYGYVQRERATWRNLLGRDLNGTPGSNSAPGSIEFQAGNGTYGYSVTAVPGYTASPNSGNLNVNGADVSQTITFTAVPTYTITFTESGLPGGTQWTVSLDGSPQGSTSSTIAFTGEPDGTYSYSVSTSDSRFSPSPASGSVKVSGADANKAITFTEQVYTLSFTESGLPGGTQWSVSINGGAPSSSSGFDHLLLGGQRLVFILGYDHELPILSVSGHRIDRYLGRFREPRHHFQPTILHGNVLGKRAPRRHDVVHDSQWTAWIELQLPDRLLRTERHVPFHDRERRILRSFPCLREGDRERRSRGEADHVHGGALHGYFYRVRTSERHGVVRNPQRSRNPFDGDNDHL